MNHTFGRRLLENDEMEMDQMGGYNPFNSPYGASTAMQSAQNWYDPQSQWRNRPIVPKTRYGMRRKKSRNPMARFMRTGGRGGRGRMNGQYPQYGLRPQMPGLMQLYQNMYGMGGGGYLDPSISRPGRQRYFGDDDEYDEYDEYDDDEDLYDDEMDEDDFDFDDSSEAAYIDEEVDFNERSRARTHSPHRPPPGFR